MTIEKAIAILENALTASEHNILIEEPECQEAWTLIKTMAQDGWDKS